MIRTHKASLSRDIVGIALCALVGVFALTKAPATVAQGVSGEHLTLNFVGLEATKMVELIAQFSGITEIRGLEQLSSMKINARFQDVPARDALQGVLTCMGFTYREEGAALAIVPLERPGVPACSDGVEVATTEL